MDVAMKPAWEQLSLFSDKELGITPSYNIIGLTGYARSGKDTLASILVEKYGYRRVAFADKIRDFLYNLNPKIHSINLQDMINEYGWEIVKQNPEVRRLLQSLGSSARDIIDDHIWITAALSSLDIDERVVITDVRFENEAAMVKSLGGQVWRVKRPGVEAVNSHASETQLDGYKVEQIFVNGGSVQDLEVLVQTRLRYAFSK